jgi:hypothetical protein
MIFVMILEEKLQSAIGLKSLNVASFDSYNSVRESGLFNFSQKVIPHKINEMVEQLLGPPIWPRTFILGHPLYSFLHLLYNKMFPHFIIILICEKTRHFSLQFPPPPLQ